MGPDRGRPAEFPLSPPPRWRGTREDETKGRVELESRVDGERGTAPVEHLTRSRLDALCGLLPPHGAKVRTRRGGSNRAGNSASLWSTIAHLDPRCASSAMYDINRHSPGRLDELGLNVEIRTEA